MVDTKQTAPNPAATAGNQGATSAPTVATQADLETEAKDEDAEVATAPYPSQADLDAIRLGKFDTSGAPKRKREAKATDGQSAGYKTR